MKAKLEFELPDEEVEFAEAINGQKWRHVVLQIHEKMREFQIRGHEFHNIEEAFEQILEYIDAEIGMQGLSLDS